MNYIESILKSLKITKSINIKQELFDRHININEDGFAIIEKSIRGNYHTGWRSESNYTESVYKNVLSSHLYARLENDRAKIVPWLNDACPLFGQHVLEIGCGTGSFVIALAEQGARLVGIDLDEGALLVARDRADVYGVEAEFRLLNATKIKSYTVHG